MATDDVLALIDKNTAIVSISHVEYRGGQRFDLGVLAEAAHAHGALLVVDASQSAGAVPIDAPALGVDAIVCTGYKWLCGPFGAAVMYLAPHLHEQLTPGLVGFRSHNEMWDLQASRVDFAPDASRFEYSTLAFGCILGLQKSIEYLNAIGIERIQSHNQRLADQLVAGLQGLGVEITSPLDESRTAIVTARFENEGVAEVLKNAGISVSTRGNIIRFSPHLYNSSDDINRTIDILNHKV